MDEPLLDLLVGADSKSFRCRRMALWFAQLKEDAKAVPCLVPPRWVTVANSDEK